MKIYSTRIPDVKIIECDQKQDNRGISFSSYNRSELENNGIDFDYKMENIYNIKKSGTLYGIHFQNNPKAQTKMVYCLKGSGIDYAIDLRKSSDTYLQWVSVELSEKNRKQIYIPKGFGHAFISLEDNTINVMRFDEPFDSRYSKQLRYDDPHIKIVYPFQNPILAVHDENAPYLNDCEIDLE